MSSNSHQRNFLSMINTEFPHNAIVMMCGLPATCKTWAASLIAERHGLTHLRTDIIRKQVLKGQDIFDEETAADMDKREMVYDIMFQKGEEIASTGKGVILDATFVKQSLRERAAKIAHKYNMPLVLVHTDCPAKVALERISRRTPDNYESNAITEQAYYNNLRAFEPIDMKSLENKFPGLEIRYLHVDTTEQDPAQWKIIN